MNMKTSFKISLCGILSAAALISFMLENLFPPIILPGARLGISNAFILLSAVLLGGKYGIATLIIKTVIGSIFAGNPSAIMYSLPAGLAALTLELILLHFTSVSVVATSVLGAVINTTVQNLTFCLVTNAVEYLLYLPYLGLIGAVGGVAVGLVVYLVVKKLPENKFINQ